ncbi:hypothetical protein GR157_31935 [Burkholderia sp. 4701]|nr:hypothetical protein [Burkholderia sp. 4701]MXN86529.1 hypothetical protein [Burkholderia sp. 4812]
MGRSRFSIGDARSDWVQPASPDAPAHRFAEQARLTSALSALFLAFAAEHDTNTLLSLAVDYCRPPRPGSTCLIAWHVEAVEPHSGFNGDLVRFNGRAWLPDGTTVMSGTARIVAYPSSRVESVDDAADDPPFPPPPPLFG